MRVFHKDKGPEPKADTPLSVQAKPGDAPSADADPDGITVTEPAAKEIRRQADKRGQPDTPIRVGIRGGGCTGFTYLFEWADEGPARDGDRTFHFHGVDVVVDPKSLRLLKGMELDFVSSMMGHGFKFNNPNAKGTCGCGEAVSF